MPIAEFERNILKLLAGHRNPESFLAGGTVLHQAADTPRTSEDLDVFHDTEEAVQAAVAQDVPLLKENGYDVAVIFNAPTFVRAVVQREGRGTKIEWVYDSAYRFFPTEPDDELGYRLNFWDAATNKVLAAASRSAIRDYIDLLHLHENRLHLGSLVWAAAAKDQGLSPGFIVEELARNQRFPMGSFESLKLVQPADPEALKKIWIKALDESREMITGIFAEAPYGCLFLDKQGNPQSPTAETLPQLAPHVGSVRGCLPRIHET
jgi:hypothetical protein